MSSAARLILGSAQLALDYGVANGSGRPTRADAVGIVQHADAVGIGAVSTSPAYGDAESLIGEAAVDLPVHTKLMPGIEPAVSIYRSLERLRRDHLDVVLIDVTATPADRVDATLDAAAAEVGMTVDRIGVTGYDARRADRYLRDERITVFQYPGSIVDRRIFDALARTHSAGDVQVRSTLLQGALCLGPERRPRHLSRLDGPVAIIERTADRLGVSVAQLALRWVLQRATVDAVVGVDSAAQLDELVDGAHASVLLSDSLADLEPLALTEIDLIDPRRWPAPTKKAAA